MQAIFFQTSLQYNYLHQLSTYALYLLISDIASYLVLIFNRSPYFHDYSHEDAELCQNHNNSSICGHTAFHCNYCSEDFIFQSVARESEVFCKSSKSTILIRIELDTYNLFTALLHCFCFQFESTRCISDIHIIHGIHLYWKPFTSKSYTKILTLFSKAIRPPTRVPTIRYICFPSPFPKNLQVSAPEPMLLLKQPQIHSTISSTLFTQQQHLQILFLQIYWTLKKV